MKKVFLFGVVLSLVLFAAACGDNVDVVDSGTYTGVIDKVNPDEEEIYVKLDNDKRIELYFNDGTELVQDSINVEFGRLKKGQQVEVTVRKVGTKLEPQKVRIIE